MESACHWGYVMHTKSTNPNIDASMKLLYIISAFTLCSCTSSYHMNQAVTQGKKKDGYYLAEFNKPAEKDKIEGWCDENGYVSLSFLNNKITRFGKQHDGLSGVAFISQYDYNEMLAAEERRKRAYANRSGGRSWSGSEKAVAIGAGLVGLGYVIKKGLEWWAGSAGSYSGSSSYSYTDASSGSTACIENEELNNDKSYLCKDKNENPVYVTTYKVKCSNGDKKYYYFLPSDIERGWYHGSIGKGYRQFDTDLNFRSDNDWKYLGKDKNSAMKKLCSCSDY